MAEFPGIMLVLALTGSDWMTNEIKSRVTPEFESAVRAVGDMYLAADKSDLAMQQIGIIYFTAQELIDGAKEEEGVANDDGRGVSEDA